MRLHLFYEFKGRIILFSGLLVSVIRNISKVMLLDHEMRVLIKRTQDLLQQEAQLSLQLKPFVEKAIKAGDKESAELKNKINYIRSNIDRLKKQIRQNISRALADIRDELKAMQKITLEDETLFYKKSIYLKNLVNAIEKSKRLAIHQKRFLLQELIKESHSLRHKVHHLDLEAKNLKRGGPSVGITTVLLAEVSPRSNQLLMRLIKRRAIEIRAMEDKLDELPKGDFKNIIATFDKELHDIYVLGGYKDVLLRRLKATFNDARMKFQNLNIPGIASDFNKTQKTFQKTFEYLEKLARRLRFEIMSKTKRFEELEELDKKKLDSQATLQQQQNVRLYNEISQTAKLLRPVQQAQQTQKQGQVRKVA